VTTLATGPAAPPKAVATLRVLGWVEIRRYARHPLFLSGVALLTVGAASVATDRTPRGDTQIAPAFLLGVLGVFVGFGLTRSARRAEEAVASTPADSTIRTAALCLTCLPTAAVAVVWMSAQLVTYAVWPPKEGWYPAVSTATMLAELLAGGVVAATGGPLIGVLVGRSTRIPGAGLLAAAALVGWVLLSTYGLAMPPSRWATLVTLNAPFAQWTTSDPPGIEHLRLAAGSPWWHLAYVTMLCGLAATAAMLHDAVGARRSQLIRVLAVLAVLAVASLALAVMPNPTQIPL
jgi:hypothetical protein